MDIAWPWSLEAAPVARLAREIAARGYAVIRADTADLAPAEAARSPWSYAERLVGKEPRMVERQPIKAVPQGRSFAAGDGPAPLHTDSQVHAGAPADVQVLVCARPADAGGEHLLIDGFTLLDRVRAADPDLYRLLFEAPRRIPFVFGDVFGPTVAERGGALAFTHAPFVARGDSIAHRLAPFVEAAPTLVFTTRAGEVLVADNRRMLHGRRAFTGAREYVRLLIWTRGELRAPAPEPHASYAAHVADRARQALASAPLGVRQRLGLTAALPGEARLSLVLAMLRGVPPGVIAARAQIPEPELYRLREAALTAAGAALSEGALPGSDEEVWGHLTG